MNQDYEKTQMADSGRTQMMQPGNEATQMVSPGAGVTQMAMNLKCPVCGSMSPGGERYCTDCGFLLSEQPVEVAAVVPTVVGKLIDTTSGRDFELKPGTNTIGRQDTDVLVNHPTVSRSHAKITVVNGSFMLEDTGSTNGTFIGNVKVQPGQPVEVKSGAEILFGSAMMRLEAASTEATIVTAPAAAEVIDAADRENLAEESEKVEGAAEVQPAPPVEAEATEQDAADASEVAQIPVSTGPDEATDATPEQALEPPVEAVEIHEEEPLAKLVAADGTEYQIKPGENTVGRRPSNSISIADPYMSGSHAAITAADDKVVLVDVGSTNGTFVGGERLVPNEPRELVDGDEIVFGQVSLKLVV